jgi:hypothetical protein
MFCRSKRQKGSNPLPPNTSEAKMPELKKVSYPVQELVEKYKDTDKLKVKWVPEASRFRESSWFTFGNALTKIKIFILKDAGLEVVFTFTQSYGRNANYRVSIKDFDIRLTDEEQEYLYTNIAARWEAKMFKSYKEAKEAKEQQERKRLGELLK